MMYQTIEILESFRAAGNCKENEYVNTNGK